MYAIIQQGSKQFRVKKGDRIAVEKTGQSEGEIVFSDEKLIFLHANDSYMTGLPGLKKGKVIGKICGTVKGPKVTSFRYRRRKDSKRTVGHRQEYQEIEIVDIVE